MGVSCLSKQFPSDLCQSYFDNSEMVRLTSICLYLYSYHRCGIKYELALFCEGLLDSGILIV